MPRSVEPIEPFREKLLKFSPTETVGTCLAALGMLSAMEPGNLQTILLWVVFAAGLLATPFWLIYKMDMRKPLQVIVSTLAFIVWMMTIDGGPFTTIPGYQLVIGSVALIIFSGLIAPLLGNIK